MISKIEYQVLGLWNAARLMTSFRLVLESEGERPTYQLGSYWSSKNNREIHHVSIRSEAMLVFSHVPQRGGQHGEVWVPHRKIAELREMFTAIHDALYSTSPAAFGRYSDNTVVLQPEASQLEWSIGGLLPGNRVMRAVLGAAPDEDGNPARMEGVVLQIENTGSMSILNWREFNTLKQLIDNVQMEMVTAQMILMLQQENLLKAIRG